MENTFTDISSTESIDDSSGTPSIPCFNSEQLLQQLLGRTEKEKNRSPEMKEQEEFKMSPEAYLPSPSSAIDQKWNVDFNMWHSVGPTKPSEKQLQRVSTTDRETVIRTHSEQNLTSKVKMVYNLLAMLGSNDREEVSKTFLALSSSPECCTAMRQSGCLPLLVQLIHGPSEKASTRKQALQVLRNIVQFQTDDKQCRREQRVLKLIEQILDYCEAESTQHSYHDQSMPGQAVSTLMKLSFDEEHRHAMCLLGALHALAKLVETDHGLHDGIKNLKPDCVLVRRFAAMALTNLTFGDGTNKALLCSLKSFMVALVEQLSSTNEDLCQVTASVLRNLSWRADTNIKQTLREMGAVPSLMKTALRMEKESTLKAVLSALWNLSAHCNSNKIDICNVEGAVEYLVKMLNYQARSGTLVIVENVGGILRNVSSHIAVREDYRSILRKHGCLQILLQHLKSPSLVIVSNACGTLWNLSARCSTDQLALWQLGAVPMLRSLIHSKHKMISVASSAALKNLLSVRPETDSTEQRDQSTPSLLIRKRRALEQELDAKLKESTNHVVSLDTSGFDSSLDSKRDEERSDSERNGFRKLEEPYEVEDAFGNYTNDLDQPTDYSLRFAEQDAIGDITDEQRADKIVTATAKETVFDTPMMFSRTSSLSSCSEQCLDDCGSVASEFSKAVTGCVSPSELPDSPGAPISPVKPLADFDDDSVKVFKDENTPMHFSVATSLSSLTFNDDPVEVAADKKDVKEFELSLNSEQPSPENKSVEKEFELTLEEEQEMLMACINSARPGHKKDPICLYTEDAYRDPAEATASLPRYANKSSNKTDSHDPVSHSVNHPTMTYTKTKIPFYTRTISDNVDLPVNYASENNENQHSMLYDDVNRVPNTYNDTSSINHPTMTYNKDSQSVSDASMNYNSSIIESKSSQPIADSTINYCTEDTPISISHATSNSDLSLLCPSEDSFLQDSILPSSACQDFTELSSEDRRKLLDMCISEGMHRSKERKPEELKPCSSIKTAKQDDPADEISKELSEEEQKNLLYQCIALGVRSINTANTDLENIGPPSFLAEANLENSLTNVDSIVSEVADSTTYSAIDDITLIEDNPSSPEKTIEIAKEKMTPKQKRHQLKDRYSTYTINSSNGITAGRTQTMDTKPDVYPKNYRMKERRMNDKDRFKTRTLSDSDFKQIAKYGQRNNHLMKGRSNDDTLSPCSSSSLSSDTESHQEPAKAKIVKPVEVKSVRGSRPRSGIPVVNKLKTPPTKGSARSSIPTKLPAPLTRQGTFTKDEHSAIPVSMRRKSSSPKTTASAENVSSQFRSGIPRIGDKARDTNTPDSDKHRWSVSENDINISPEYRSSDSTESHNSRGSACALPIKREIPKMGAGWRGPKLTSPSVESVPIFRRT